jgi:hypothetical protein
VQLQVGKKVVPILDIEGEIIKESMDSKHQPKMLPPMFLVAHVAFGIQLSSASTTTLRSDHPFLLQRGMVYIFLLA